MIIFSPKCFFYNFFFSTPNIYQFLLIYMWVYCRILLLFITYNGRVRLYRKKGQALTANACVTARKRTVRCFHVPRFVTWWWLQRTAFVFWGDLQMLGWVSQVPVSVFPVNSCTPVVYMGVFLWSKYNKKKSLFLSFFPCDYCVSAKSIHEACCQFKN